MFSTKKLTKVRRLSYLFILPCLFRIGPHLRAVRGHDDTFFFRPWFHIMKRASCVCEFFFFSFKFVFRFFFFMLRLLPMLRSVWFCTSAEACLYYGRGGTFRTAGAARSRNCITRILAGLQRRNLTNETDDLQHSLTRINPGCARLAGDDYCRTPMQVPVIETRIAFTLPPCAACSHHDKTALILGLSMYMDPQKSLQEETTRAIDDKGITVFLAIHCVLNE